MSQSQRLIGDWQSEIANHLLLLGTINRPRCLNHRLSGELFSFPGERLKAMVMLILLEVAICIFALTEETSTDFNDLGKLMLVGFGAAIVFALGFTFIRLRLRDKTPQTSSFISISPTKEKNEEAGNS